MQSTQGVHWTQLEKISFRFIFIMLLLFILFYNNLLPFLEFATTNISQFLVKWVAKDILLLDVEPTPGRGGSGDTLFHYILLLIVAIISTIGCIIWSAFDHAKGNYNRLFYWLTVIVRFYLGIMLIQYGIAKIIKTQFASPDLMRLLTIYGDSSPMGLAWTFFGFSDGYNIFMGIAEVSCALLLFRRTAVLGAIIALMVCVNVMAVNYFFDIPVKILSTALVLMSCFILAPNGSRLIDFLIRGKSVGLKMLDAPVFKKRWLIISKSLFKFLIIGVCIVPILYTTLSRRNMHGDGAPRLPLYGVYIVDSFESERPVPKWKKLIIQRSDFSAVEIEGSNAEYINIKVDTARHELALSFKDDLDVIHKFSYHIEDADYLELKGVYIDSPLKVKLHKQHFELIERQFNWVSEDPYNR